MKQLNTMAGQGDVMLINLDAYTPEQIKEMGFEVCTLEESLDGENVIVTHSESGHHHVIERSKVVQMLISKTNAFIGKLKLEDATTIEHLRSFDTHEAITLPKNVGFKRQREYTPKGYRKAQD